MRKVSVVALVIWALLLLPFAGVASAQEGSMMADAGTVVAEGLNGPMGILVDPDGMIWVIDSGLGGEEDIPWISTQGEPITAQAGDTAQVVKINSADGSQEVVANLPSVATGEEFVGGARLALLDGTLYATVGQGIGAPDLDLPDTYGAVVQIDADGDVTPVANLWDFERTENPDPAIYDSHPYGLAAGPDGYLYVADAAGNDLLKIDPDTGEIQVVTVFEPIPGVFPRPDRGGELLTDPVPTGVVVAEDGSFYVAYLSGAPFVPGSAKVVKVSPAGEVSDYATGLTMLTDLRMAPDGELYAVQFGLFTETGPVPASGAVVHVMEGEGSMPVIEGLSFPTSIDFNEAGDAYVTVNGAGAPASGAVLMFAELAAGEEMAAEESAKEPAEEMAAEELTEKPAEEMSAEEPSEEMSAEAPETLPVTGGSLSSQETSSALLWLVSGLVLSGLAAGAYVQRRLTRR